MIYAVNVHSYRTPNNVCVSSGLTGHLHAFQGFRTLDRCFRQVAIVADSPGEALEKAESVEVYIDTN